MRAKEPSRKEKARAVRYMRHVENCHKCTPPGACVVAIGHYRRWARSYYKEVYLPAEKRRMAKARWGLPRS